MVSFGNRQIIIYEELAVQVVLARQNIRMMNL